MQQVVLLEAALRLEVLGADDTGKLPRVGMGLDVHVVVGSLLERLPAVTGENCDVPSVQALVTPVGPARVKVLPQPG